jgi:hypothetical protein
MLSSTADIRDRVWRDAGGRHRRGPVWQRLPHDASGRARAPLLRQHAQLLPIRRPRDEILNDYAGGITPRYETAIAAWERYLNNVNPTRMQSATRSSHYAFDAGSAGFFFTDTRTLRDQSRGVLIGEQQLGDIQAWLAAKQAEPTPSFKGLVSTPGWSRNDPDPTANWRCRCRAMTEENKASCPNEPDRLMDWILSNNITGVMLLSGDTHKPGVFEIAPGIFDLSASPMHGLSDEIYPPGGPDRELFDRAGLSEVCSVVEIDATSATVKIYGGGPSMTAIRVVLVTLYLGAAWIVAVTILRAEPDAAPKLMRDNKVVMAVAAPLIVALIVGSVLLLPPLVDKSFHEPIFQKTLTL